MDESMNKLLLTTQGRYSGRAEISALNYLIDDEDYLVIATNQKYKAKPDWYLNLKEEPIVQLELGGAKFYARATTPTGKERLRIMNRIKDAQPVEDKVPRETSAVVLSPLC